MIVGRSAFTPTSYRPESKTLVRGAVSASRKPRAYRLAHQTAPRRGGAQLGVVTCGVADAAADPPAGGLGLGRLGAVLRRMVSPWRSGCSNGDGRQCSCGLHRCCAPDGCHWFLT